MHLKCSLYVLGVSVAIGSSRRNFLFRKRWLPFGTVVVIHTLFITVVAIHNISVHASSDKNVTSSRNKSIIRISGSQHVIYIVAGQLRNFKSYKMADQQQLLQLLIKSAIAGVKKIVDI